MEQATPSTSTTVASQSKKMPKANIWKLLIESLVSKYNSLTMEQQRHVWAVVMRQDTTTTTTQDWLYCTAATIDNESLSSTTRHDALHQYTRFSTCVNRSVKIKQEEEQQDSPSEETLLAQNSDKSDGPGDTAVEQDKNTEPQKSNEIKRNSNKEFPPLSMESTRESSVHVTTTTAINDCERDDIMLNDANDDEGSTKMSLHEELSWASREAKESSPVSIESIVTTAKRMSTSGWEGNRKHTMKGVSSTVSGSMTDESPSTLEEQQMSSSEAQFASSSPGRQELLRGAGSSRPMKKRSVPAGFQTALQNNSTKRQRRQDLEKQSAARIVDNVRNDSSSLLVEDVSPIQESCGDDSACETQQLEIPPIAEEHDSASHESPTCEQEGNAPLAMSQKRTSLSSLVKRPHHPEEDCPALATETPMQTPERPAVVVVVVVPCSPPEEQNVNKEQHHTSLPAATAQAQETTNRLSTVSPSTESDARDKKKHGGRKHVKTPFVPVLSPRSKNVAGASSAHEQKTKFETSTTIGSACISDLLSKPLASSRTKGLPRQPLKKKKDAPPNKNCKVTPPPKTPLRSSASIVRKLGRNPPAAKKGKKKIDASAGKAVPDSRIGKKPRSILPIEIHEITPPSITDRLSTALASRRTVEQDSTIVGSPSKKKAVPLVTAKASAQTALPPSKPLVSPQKIRPLLQTRDCDPPNQQDARGELSMDHKGASPSVQCRDASKVEPRHDEPHGDCRRELPWSPPPVQSDRPQQRLDKRYATTPNRATRAYCSSRKKREFPYRPAPHKERRESKESQHHYWDKGMYHHHHRMDISHLNRSKRYFDEREQLRWDEEQRAYHHCHSYTHKSSRRNRPLQW